MTSQDRTKETTPASSIFNEKLILATAQKPENKLSLKIKPVVESGKIEFGVSKIKNMGSETIMPENPRKKVIARQWVSFIFLVTTNFIDNVIIAPKAKALPICECFKKIVIIIE